MGEGIRHRGRRIPLGLAAAAAGVAAMTALIHATPGAAHTASIPMLYLLVVIGMARWFGSGPAVLASILAFLAFDWFFVDPLHTFTVDDPTEWIALLVFLTTATVTGHLTALLGARAEEARRHERESVALADASLAIASRVDRDSALAELLRRLSDVVPVEAAAIYIPGPREPNEVARHGADGAAVPEAVRTVLETGRAVAWDEEPVSRVSDANRSAAITALPLLIEERVLGALCLRLQAGLSPQQRRVAQSLASQAAVVLERDRLARAETAARALAEADRLKTALLSMVSHDFRSPLTSIKASVTALLQKGTDWDPDLRTELLQGIEQETDRIDGMVANILALSRLQADAWRPRREATPVPELVGAALASFGPEENRRIEVTLDPALPEAWLDPVQMVQVLRNLVENALKYSPAGSPVELHAFAQDGDLTIEVLDRGMGLPVGEEDRVFEPFYRDPILKESSAPGVGIGLAVCRGLVEAHRGTLAAEPRSGGGAVFRIELAMGDNA